MCGFFGVLVLFCFFLKCCVFTSYFGLGRSPRARRGLSCKAGPLPWKYAKVLAGVRRRGGVGAAGASWKPQPDNAWLAADKPGASSSAPARAFRRNRRQLL